MDIIWSSLNTIQGTTPAQDFTAGVSSVVATGNTRQLRNKDAVYTLPEFRINLALGGSAAGLQVTEPSGNCQRISNTEFILNNYPLPDAAVSFLPRVVPAVPATGSDVVVDLSASNGQTARKITQQVNVFPARDSFHGSPEGVGRPIVFSIDAGCLATHVTNNVLAMINAKTPSATNQRLFSAISTQGTANPSATRSTGHIASAYDLTGCSVWGNDSEQQLPAVLITPLHAYISHVTRNVGETFTWVTAGNIKQTRTIVSQVGSPGGWQVVRLNAPITDCTPFEIAPSNILSYLPSLEFYRRFVPVVAISRNFGYGSYDGGVIGIRHLCQLSAADGRYSHLQSPNTPFSQWSWNLSVGDSNNPFMLPVNGKMMLVGTEYFGNGGITLYGGLRTTNQGDPQSLETLVTGLGGGYQVTRANLSAFPTY